MRMHLICRLAFFYCMFEIQSQPRFPIRSRQVQKIKLWVSRAHLCRSKWPWNIIHLMPYRTPCRRCIHLVVTYSIDPSNVVGLKLGPTMPSPPMRVLEVQRELMTNTLQALTSMERAELVQVHFTLCLRDQWSMWMQDGCKVYMDFYMAPNGSCFMVTWNILKNILLEVGLTQNRETMAHQTLTTIGLFYFIVCEDPHEQKFILMAFWLGVRSHMTSQYTWRSTLHVYGGVLGRPLDTLFWALTISWSWLLARVWSRALHWVPIPMPTHAHGFWVGMDAILLVML